MSADLDRRLEALAEAVDLADGRLDDERVQAARAVVERAGQRLGLGVDDTVIALAGPTGAGKSTVFNSLAGESLVAVSRRRPTTSVATAAVWGDAGRELLDWLEVPRRHTASNGDLSGLVLLDLPDYDSVEIDHRLEVERLIGLVDLLVWIVDPQKYADSALHDRYLRGLAEYEESMFVVLNQSDVLPRSAVEACRDDLRRLLSEDGLDGVPVLAASALTGEGLPELREELTKRVKLRTAAAARLSADVVTVSTALAAEGGGTAAGIHDRDREHLVTALSGAAGVPTVVDAVRRAHRRRGILACGWPFARWVRRLRPDPLRRLRLSDRPGEERHTSVPSATPVQREQVTAATRLLAAGAADGLPPPWPAHVRSAATAREDELAERLDRAVAGADLHMTRPRWWRGLSFLQSVLALVTAAGALWLLALVLLGFLRIEDVVPLPEVGGIPIPTALLLGGALAGMLLALLARLVNGAGARRRARKAERSLRARVEAVGADLVIGPIEEALAVHDRLYDALARARGEGGGRRLGR
ncbi:MAG TPA: GTPase [Gaiellaceae bacterium]|nr:GTPase [Gaiellaceae bacterium]